MSTARHVHSDRHIVEIERAPLRRRTEGVPAVELARVSRRHDPTVALLLVVSVVSLVVGIATLAIGAWLVGVVSLVTAFSVDTRHERELRDLRRSSELDHRRRHHRASW